MAEYKFKFGNPTKDTATNSFKADSSLDIRAEDGAKKFNDNVAVTLADGKAESWRVTTDGFETKP